MVIDIDQARRLADPQSFQRGREYAMDRAVGRIRRLADGVRATVFGSDDYTVELRSGRGAEPAFRCTCPVGASGAFCKHCVALAHAVSGSGHSERSDPRAYLESLGSDELIEIVLDAAQRDEVTHTRLAVASAGTDSSHTLRRAIDDAIVPGGYVPYREAYAYTQGVDVVIDRLEELLASGDPGLVMDLTEHAIGCAERAVEFVDDSDGLLGGVAERLAELHLAACEAARPDPARLAARLYARELGDGDLEAFFGAVSRYGGVLGEPGLAVYRELAERDWAALPASRAGEFDGRRHRLASILEALAELTGDVDAEVEVMARDLSSAYQFVRIAERYRRADRYGDALRWAEQGVEAFGTSDARLVELAADGYHRAGRGPEAVQLFREVLDAAPTLGNYQRLAEHARRVGSWPAWREWALDRVRDELSRREAPRYRWQPPVDAGLLVEIFLWEGDPDQAWDEARRGGCSGPVVMRLARACRDRRPAEVIPLYEKEVESLIEGRTNGAYAQAVELLDEVEALFAQAGNTDGFPDYVAGLRRRHKPKRNLMKLLDARR